MSDNELLYLLIKKLLFIYICFIYNDHVAKTTHYLLILKLLMKSASIIDFLVFRYPRIKKQKINEIAAVDAEIIKCKEL